MGKYKAKSNWFLQDNFPVFFVSFLVKYVCIIRKNFLDYGKILYATTAEHPTDNSFSLIFTLEDG